MKTKLNLEMCKQIVLEESEYEVEIIETRKGESFAFGTGKAKPCIPVKAIYDSMKDEEDIGEYMEGLNELVRELVGGAPDVEDKMNKEYILKHAYIELVARDEVGSVTRPFFHLTVRYRVDAGVGSFNVSNSMADTLDISEEELYEAALCNFSPEIKTYSSMIEEILKERIEAKKTAYIDVPIEYAEERLGHQQMCVDTRKGCAANNLLNRELLDMIHEERGDFLIVPITKNELIFTDDDEEQLERHSYAQKGMKEFVNENDWLTHHIFRYNGELSIAK